MFITRWFHRRGFGIQSPWAYELVTQVLSNKKDLLARLTEYLGDEPRWELVDDIRGKNRQRWHDIVADPAATAIFDMGRQGLAVYDPKRWKQEYKI